MLVKLRFFREGEGNKDHLTSGNLVTILASSSAVLILLWKFYALFT